MFQHKENPQKEAQWGKEGGSSNSKKVQKERCFLDCRPTLLAVPPKRRGKEGSTRRKTGITIGMKEGGYDKSTGSSVSGNFKGRGLKKGRGKVLQRGVAWGEKAKLEETKQKKDCVRRRSNERTISLQHVLSSEKKKVYAGAGDLGKFYFSYSTRTTRINLQNLKKQPLGNEETRLSGTENRAYQKGEEDS